MFLCLLTSTARAQWTHYAAEPARLSTSNLAPPPLTPAWTANLDVNDDPITFVGLASVVTDGDHVYALGASAGESRVYAFDPLTGEALWQSPIPTPALDSWSAPAVNDVVVVASADELQAFDPASGAEIWATILPDLVVNASPLIAADRVFITTFKPFGVAELVCVNATTGDILWAAPVGPASGATPAWRDSVVYVATTDARILAFDAGADETPDPLWTFTNPEGHGFFSSPAVTLDAIYAASYAFDAGQLNANLVKLNRAGELQWSTPAGRTDAAPIPVEDRIFLSAGLHGFGSTPSIQAFTDHGDHAALDWDSALDSWVDADNDGAMDPGEHLNLGGWTHQPIAAADRLIVGAHPPGAGPFDAYSDLYVIDAARSPSDPAFILDHSTNAGTTPALDPRGLYSIGPAGLTAFLACTPDCNADGVLNILDFVCFQQRFTAGDAGADCNNDGVLNILDFVCFQQQFVQGCE